MSYGDPCVNDPTHPPAVVGIGSPYAAEAKWVCMDCFNESLRTLNGLIHQEQARRG